MRVSYEVLGGCLPRFTAKDSAGKNRTAIFFIDSLQMPCGRTHQAAAADAVAAPSLAANTPSCGTQPSRRPGSMGGRFLAYSSWRPRRHRKWVHPALFLQPSTVPGAGVGVFAARDIPQGSHLGYYCGRVFWTYPKRNKRGWAYVMEVSRRPPWIPRETWRARRQAGTPPYVDGKGTLSLVNCCRGGRTQNADFSASGRFFTLCDVKAGEELFLCYGDDYWDSRTP